MMDAMMQTRSKSEKFTHIFSYQNGAVTKPAGEPGVTFGSVKLPFERGNLFGGAAQGVIHGRTKQSDIG